ncbi:helix-turn-helix domain-containing protein [Nostoc sp.]|uniref:helix-turn-helix domain-containing protein n=1 Tax=Nostoc sp. TaxID=1180 RepID=UPI002FFCA6FD
MMEAIKELGNPAVPLHVKPLLTLSEAQKLSGLSRQYLIQAIRENRLKGDKIGKAWRVKRRDLERFVASLF